MDEIIQDKDIQKLADKITDDLVRHASNSNMSRKDVKNSVLYFQTIQSIMGKYDCNAFTVECFELCSSMNPWNRRFTPCLAHALNKDNGFSSACEKDLNALMAMMIEMYLSNKAIYMGNPDVDVKNNTLSIHHSVASLKMHGLDKSNSPYEIDSFTQEGFGATLRHDFEQDEGQPVTMARFDPSATKILVTRGTIIGGGGMDGCGCAQRVNMAIPNGKEFLHQQQNFGHHLAMVFGDYVEDIDRPGELMKYETVAVV